jgi:hypothetical protein
VTVPHWHVVVEAPDELYGRRAYVVQSLPRAEDEREYEKMGSTRRRITIVNCGEDCLGYASPPKAASA